MAWLDKTNAKLKKFVDDLEAKVRGGGNRNSTTLDELLSEPPAPTWTEAELVKWVNTLPNDQRMAIIERAKKLRARGSDPLKMIAIARREYEANSVVMAGAAALSGLETLCDLYLGFTAGNVIGDYWEGKFTKK